MNALFAAHRVSWLRSLWLCLTIVAALPLLTLAQVGQPNKPTTQPAAKPPTPIRGIPASRAASNVVVITIKGEIDEWTARSVQRRIAEAEAGKADALVFELDTPGGEGQAMLAITSMIKSCKIGNTVAWVRPNAYSAGCVIALACREIVIADGAVIGDALPIAVNILEGLQKMGDAEREKLLGPIMVDIIESARKNGYDEVLVQGFVRRGVELWQVEHVETGKTLFVTEAQYRLVIGPDSPADPPRTAPLILSITGSTGTRPAGPAAKPEEPAQTPTDFTAAAPNIADELKDEINRDLGIKGVKSVRPDLTAPEHAGKYRLVQYVSDGAGVITLKDQQVIDFGLATQKVNSDEDLKTYFGATNLVRLDETYTEQFARFLSNPLIKGVLIIIFLIALFVEMIHPGMILPGSIAAIALVGLVLPSLIAGLAGWVAVAAIFVGILLIAVELFIAPGIGVFAILGAILLFGGLIGTFVTNQSMFPGQTSNMVKDLGIGLTVTFVSLVVAGVGISVLIRSLGSIPVLNRFVLKEVSGQADPDLGSEPADAGVGVKVGEQGVVVTPLRPAGRVQVDGENAPIIDAVSDGPFLDSGTRVRVTSATRFRVTVERAEG